MSGEWYSCIGLGTLKVNLLLLFLAPMWGLSRHHIKLLHRRPKPFLSAKLFTIVGQVLVRKRDTLLARGVVKIHTCVHKILMKIMII